MLCNTRLNNKSDAKMNQNLCVWYERYLMWKHIVDKQASENVQHFNNWLQTFDVK